MAIESAEETTAVVPYNKDPTILMVKDSIADMEGQEKEIVIKDGQTEKNAVALRGTVKDHLKALKNARAFYLAPYETEVKKIKDCFIAITDPLESIVSRLKTKGDNWMMEQKRIADAQAEKERIKAEKAIEAGKVPKVAIPVVQPTGPVRTEAGSLSKSFEWHGTVITEDQVPDTITHEGITYKLTRREIMQSGINEAVKAGVRTIPGVDIKEQPKTSMR